MSTSQTTTPFPKKTCAAASCDADISHRHSTAKYCCKEHASKPNLCLDCGKRVGRNRCSSCASKVCWRNPKHRDRVSQASTRVWQNPEFREKRSEATKLLWEDPQYREKVNAGLDKALNESDLRERRSAAAKAMWADPRYREKNSAGVKAAWQNPESAFHSPEFREKMRAIMNSPQMHKTLSDASKALWDNPDYREKVSAERKALWGNPDYREKVSVGLKAALNNPEVRERRSKAMKVLWEDPEFREKVFQGHLRNASNDITYPSYFNQQTKPLIHARADRCEYCGGSHDWMDVHHIDHNPQNNHPYNLILLCRRCHQNYGNNDAGRYDHEELGAGFETIAQQASRAMPLGWWDSINHMLDYAERWGNNAEDLHGSHQLQRREE